MWFTQLLIFFLQGSGSYALSVKYCYRYFSVFDFYLIFSNTCWRILVYTEWKTELYCLNFLEPQTTIKFPIYYVYFTAELLQPMIYLLVFAWLKCRYCSRLVDWLNSSSLIYSGINLFSVYLICSSVSLIGWYLHFDAVPCSWYVYFLHSLTA